ncbi:MAG: PhnD/SsuA/transferrin family substrate-binding protein [Phycisphaerae bacterium]|jgi:ABC-type phosphate/phosphonate transport system substrate-binding protein
MRRSAQLLCPLLLLVILTTLTGCQSASLRFLSLIGIKKDPLVVALVAERQTEKQESALAIFDPFAPYQKMQTALGDSLARPVGLDLCFPIQLPAALRSGMSHLAIISPGQYARLDQRESYPVVAFAVDRNGQTTRPAVLIVPAKSDITCVEDLRGRTVTFGPAGNGRAHLAALRLLAAHGLAKKDLSLELLPVPGSLKHMPNARSLAQTVMNLSSDAGFLDIAAWNDLPPHSDAQDEPAQDRLRVVAETTGVPIGLVVASPKLPEATVTQVREALLDLSVHHADAMQPLGITGYVAPTPELLDACAKLVEKTNTAPADNTNP